MRLDDARSLHLFHRLCAKHLQERAAYQELKAARGWDTLAEDEVTNVLSPRRATLWKSDYKLVVWYRYIIEGTSE